MKQASLGKRDERIDILNGIGILFVVLGHYNYQMEYQSWSDWIWSFHMPLFFFTGGYLFSLYQNKYLKNGILKYIIDQSRHLLIPYVFFFFLSWIVMDILMPFCKNRVLALNIEEIKNVVKALFLGGGYLESINFPLWFLQCYFIVKILFYIWCWVRSKNQYVSVIIIVFVFGAIIPFQRIVVGRPAFHINVLPSAIVFMWIGYLFCTYQDRAKTLLANKVMIKEILALLLGYLGMIIAYKFPGNVACINSYYYIVGATATIIALYISTSFFTSRLVAWWGGNSIMILGLHGLVLGFFRNYIQQRIFVEWDGPLVYFALSGLVMIVLSLMIVIWDYAKRRLAI